VWPSWMSCRISLPTFCPSQHKGLGLENTTSVTKASAMAKTLT
jgi:hypothetical protein